MFKQIWRLSKLQMYNLFGINEFRHTKDKSKRRRFVLMAVAWSMVILMLVSYVVGLSYGLIKLGMGEVLPMYLYAVVSIIMLIFTFFKAGSVLFFMKGYEMLVTLPMSKAAIVVSRFMTMYTSNLLLSCLVMIPGVMVYGIMETPSIVFYIIYVIGMVFLPLLPLTIASIIGAAITAVSSRMRRKSMAQALLTILLVVAILGVTMLLPSEEKSISMDMLKNMAKMIEEQIGMLYPPALWFNNAVFGELGYIMGFLGIPLAIFVIFVAVLQKYFQGICTLLNGVSAKNNYKLETMKSQSVVKALWRKELKRYFASSIYVTNTIIGYVLAVVAAVALFALGTEKIEELLGISGIQSVLEMVLPFVYAVMMSMATMTSCSISMEGKNFWILQTLPLGSRDVYFAKILANLTVAAPFYVVSVIMGCLLVKSDIVECIWMVIISACYIVYTAVLGITVNIAFPSFNWDNEVQVVKQSAATLVSMIAGMLSGIVPAVVMVLVGEDKANITRFIIVVVLIIVTLALYKRNENKELQRIV